MLSIGETAGLGMKAKDAEFKDQFRDKKVQKFTYTKNGEKGDDKDRCHQRRYDYDKCSD